MDQSFILGIEDIDKQHQALFDQLDLLRDYVRRGQSRDAIRDTLKFLESYVIEHFAVETGYMNTYGYPDLQAHQEEHEAFLEDFAGFREKFSSLQTKGEMTTFLGLEIVRKLNAWLAEHIMTVDKKLGAFLLQKMSETP
jgi:hemerythrin-like metal-binding protein